MILDALFVIFSMRLFLRPLLLNVSPRFLWCDTEETIPSNSIFWRCSYSFRVNKRVSVFRKLKFINHCFAQANTMFRLWLIMSLRSCIEDAKSIVKLRRELAKSFTSPKNKNKRGPRTDPKGIAELIGRELETQGLMTTR